MKSFLIYMLKFYKKNISFLFNGSCKFCPSCSEYFLEAIEKFGVLKGCFLGFRRLLKCNPFFKGGFDPVVKFNKKS